MTPEVEQPAVESHGRTGMLLFLASETMFFVGLVGAFMVLRGGNAELFAEMARAPNRVAGAAEVTALFAGVIAIFLSAKKGRACMGAAMACGAVFLAILAMEYRWLWTHDDFMRKNVFLACYWTLTGVHALHVIGGIIALSIAWLWKVDRRVVGFIGIYWLFVACVGLFLYPLLHFP